MKEAVRLFRFATMRAVQQGHLLGEGGLGGVAGLHFSIQGLDAVHAEDMSLLAIGGGAYRMYYAACDRSGNWRVVSAVTASISRGG